MQYMNRFLLVLLFIIPTFLYSQDKKVIEYDSLSFHTSVMNWTDNVQKRYLRKMGSFKEDFTQFWASGNVTEEQRQTIYHTTNILQKSQIYFYPQQYQYFVSVMNIINAKQNTVFNEYNKAIDSLCALKDLTYVNNFISRNNLFFAKKELVTSNKISWKVRCKEYSLGYDSLPYISFKKSVLVGYTKKDSSVISNTNAKYYPTSLKWIGNGGVLDWERGGYDKKEVYAEINKYKINLTESGYDIDTVNFYFKKLFSEPLIGHVEERIKMYKNEKYISFPKFHSYEGSLMVHDFFEGVDLVGGFSVEGNEMIGSSTPYSLAVLKFYSNKKQVVTVKSDRFILKNNKALSKSASVSVYLENDSIYHPNLFFEYTVNNHRISLMMDQKKTLMPYFNSYHKIDMYCRGVEWKIGDPMIEFKDIMSMDKIGNASFESFDFYSEDRYNDLQGISSVHPLQLLSNFSRSIGQRKFNIDALQEYMHKPLNQVEIMLLKLASRGFVIYDRKTNVVILKDRMFSFLMAKYNMVDFDYLRIASQVQNESNAILDLRNFDLNIKGVPVVVLSRTKNVLIYPKKKELLMKKNRSFLFSGEIRAGNFDFFADSAYFDYNDFTINLPMVDSLQFAVQSFNKNKAGKYQMVPVQSVLENLSGNIVIDKVDNKSGRKNTAEYPIFNSNSVSYVFFDKNSITPNIYDRERFVYMVNPFIVDSLDNFIPKALSFEGYLKSNIFPDIDQPLKIQKDYSLGFITKVDSGISIYSDKGKYYNDITLDFEGLKGKGEFDYLTSHSVSEEINFYPDSVNARLLSFDIKGQVKGVEYPEVHIDTVSSHWMPSIDSMYIYNPVSPFKMYDDKVSLDGSLMLTPSALKGEGVASIDLASIESKTFEFYNSSFYADASDMNILTPDKNSLAIKVKNYSSSIDLVKGMGDFSQNERGSTIEFPINQYISYHDSLNWFIDEERIELAKNESNGINGFDTLTNRELVDADLHGAEFVSIHPDQDSLKFYSLKAEYDLSDDIINASNVKYIKVADIAVFPEKEMLTIGKDALINTLYNAEILADVNKKYFELYDATVDITSRSKYNATGYYDYVDLIDGKQKIFFTDIHPDSSLTTIAEAKISYDDNFKLSPAFEYYGDVRLNAKKKSLLFDGAYRINTANCSVMKHPWLLMKTTVDPNNILIDIDSVSKDVDANNAYAGVFFDVERRDIYSSFLKHKTTYSDKEIMQCAGKLLFDNKVSSYKVASVEKLNDFNIAGDYMSYNTEQCRIAGSGKIKIPGYYGQVELKSYGNVFHDKLTDSISFDMMLAMDFYFSKAATKLMSDSIQQANLKGVEVNLKEYENRLSSIIGEEKSALLMKEINLYGVPKKIPEGLNSRLVFNKVTFSWNDKRHSFISTGPIGIANIKNNALNKYVDGIIEIQPVPMGGNINVFLQVTEKSWYFFSYSNGVMQSFSSDNHFNDILIDTKRNRRVSESKKGEMDYEYVVSTRGKYLTFIRDMKRLGISIIHVK